MARLSHFVVANTWRYASGWAPYPLHITQVRNPIDEHSTDGSARLTFDAPINAIGFSQLVSNWVITAVCTDGTWEEWQIDSKTVDGPGSGVGSFVALGYARALATAPPVRRTDADGNTVFSFEYPGLTATQHLTNTVMQALTDAGLTFFVLGTIAPTDTRTISYKGDPYATLQAIAAAFACEFYFERDDVHSQVKIHLVKKIGSGQTGADLRLGQNAALALTQQGSSQATRIYGHGTDDSTIAANRWTVTAKSGSGPFTITLADPNGGDGPIGMDDQLNGLYLEAVNRSTRTAIATSNFATQQITIATNGSSYTVGDQVRICRTSAGEGLTYLEHPANKTAYGLLSDSIDRDDIAAVGNLLPNPDMTTWTGSATVPPDGWATVGSPTLTRTTTTGLFVTGGKSCRVQATADGVGLATPLVRISPTALSPFVSGFLSFRVASGAVRVELVATDGTTSWVVPDGITTVASTTKKDVFTSVGVAGIDLNRLGATQARLRIVQLGTAALDCYVDAGQLTESAGQLVFFNGNGANVLWQAMNNALQLRAPLPQQFDAKVADLYNLNSTKFPQNQLILGALHPIHDPSTNTVDSVRVLLIRRQLHVEAATEVTLSSLPEDLASIVAGQDPNARQAGTAVGVLVPSGARTLLGVAIFQRVDVSDYELPDRSADVGKTIWIPGAGAGGAVLKTTVTSILFGSFGVTLPAGATVSSAMAIIGTPGDVLTLAVGLGGQNANGAVTDDAGTLSAQVKDAQAREVVLMYAKAIASDPDSLDAIADGLSYLKQIPLLVITVTQTSITASTLTVSVAASDPTGGSAPTISNDGGAAVTSLGGGSYAIALQTAVAGPLNVLFTAAKTGRQSAVALVAAPVASRPSLHVEVVPGSSSYSVYATWVGQEMRVDVNHVGYGTTENPTLWQPQVLNRATHGSGDQWYNLRVLGYDGTYESYPVVVPQL